MLIANIEWIGALCSALSLACVAQLIITGLLAILIPDMLLLTGTHFSTSCGLVAGFVALPTALRIKSARITPNMDKIYGYTLCYQRLAVSVCGCIHFAAAIFAIIALIVTKDLHGDLFGLMKTYHKNINSKTNTDNIQFALQCCGSQSYKDWYEIDWRGLRCSHVEHKKGKHPQLKDSNKVNNGNSSKISNCTRIRHNASRGPSRMKKADSVPYSCCMRDTRLPCVHQHLLRFGTNTINKSGCSTKLLSSARSLLWSELIFYFFCLFLEIAVLALLKTPKPNRKCSCDKHSRIERGSSFDQFSNSSVAQIDPSSHTQHTVKRKTHSKSKKPSKHPPEKQNSNASFNAGSGTSKRSKKSEVSKGTPKSKLSNNSNESQQSKESHRSKKSRESPKSGDSIKSKGSQNSKDSQKSKGSKTSKRSLDSKGSQRSIEIQKSAEVFNTSEVEKITWCQTSNCSLMLKDSSQSEVCMHEECVQTSDESLVVKETQTSIVSLQEEQRALSNGSKRSIDIDKQTKETKHQRSKEIKMYPCLNDGIKSLRKKSATALLKDTTLASSSSRSKETIKKRHGSDIAVEHTSI